MFEVQLSDDKCALILFMTMSFQETFSDNFLYVGLQDESYVKSEKQSTDFKANELINQCPSPTLNLRFFLR